MGGLGTLSFDATRSQIGQRSYAAIRATRARPLVRQPRAPHAVGASVAATTGEVMQRAAAAIMRGTLYNMVV